MQPFIGPSLTYSYLSAASTNAAVAIANNVILTGFLLFNFDTDEQFLKLYQMNSTPDENDTPYLRLMVPGNTAGAGVAAGVLPNVLFTPGLAHRIVAGVADDNTDASPANVIVNLFYMRPGE